MARIIGTAGSAPAAKPAKARSTAPPQSPDSRDNNRAARRTAKVKVPSATRVARQQEQAYASQGRAIAKRAAVFHHPQHPNAVQRAHEAEQQYRAQGRAVRRDAARQRKAAEGTRVPSGHGVGHLIATVPVAGPIGAAIVHGASAAGHLVGDYVHTVAHGNYGGMEVVPSAGRVVGRSAKDAEEMAVTLPSSVTHLAVTTATDPGKVPGLLAQPYVQLAHDPVKALSEHPLQTALLVAPAVRMPGRALGRGARLVGKQTLERPAAELPGTALKVNRTGSRDVVVRAMQSRADRKTGTPIVTEKQIAKRVDEFYDFARQHTARVRASAARDATATAKANGLGRADRRALVQAKVEGAGKGAKTQVKARFVQEFGATWQRSPYGIVKPKGATEGMLHATREDAQAVADRLNRDSTVEFSVMKVDGKRYGVVPQIAKARLARHKTVGKSPALGAAMLRTTGRAFRASVLPLSQKWLAGQAVEAGIRSVVAGAGPMDLLRMGKVVKKLNAERPGAGDELAMRITGGQFGLTGTAREFANGRSLADEFSKTALAKPAAVATKVGQTAPLRAVRTGWNGYTRAVMGGINGVFENTARKAMAGQAIRSGRLMEHKIIGLSDRAITDAAKGLHGTEAQIELGRAVDRMYGRYQKFSPDVREQLLHFAPFAPWTANVVTFLTRVLPVDHPVKAALLADINALEEDWRKSHGLSLLDPNHKPSVPARRIPDQRRPSRARRPLHAVRDHVARAGHR
jgi:hypothetical protein